jgi:glycosyltransferase involved in cell wall biosynthesis
MSTISILVLSKNNGRTIGRTLLSILRSKSPPHYQREVIVIDAHSNDNTPSILSLFSKHIRVVYDEGKE